MHAYCEQAFCPLAKNASEDGKVSFQIEINIFVPQNCFLDMQGVLESEFWGMLQLWW